MFSAIGNSTFSSFMKCSVRTAWAWQVAIIDIELALLHEHVARASQSLDLDLAESALQILDDEIDPSVVDFGGVHLQSI